MERERESWGGEGRGGMDTEKVRVRKAGDMSREWVNKCMCVGERWWGGGTRTL